MEFHVDYNDTPYSRRSQMPGFPPRRSNPYRQNWRCEILLTRNLHAVKDQTVLDLASYDGRLSYGLKKLGAKHVVAIEGRSEPVEAAKSHFEELGLEADFRAGDLFDYLPTVEEGVFDTICCFGFFYHTVRQYELLAQVKRIKPKYFILDTRIIPFEDEPLFSIRWEDPIKGKLDTIDPLGLVFMLSKTALEFMLEKFGFRARELKWHEAGIEDWTHLGNYQDETRVSYFCENS